MARCISLITAFLIITVSACGQHYGDRTVLGKPYAEMELKAALSGKAEHNIIDNKKIIIKDSETAIRIVEPILFDIYGKEEILDQRPYETYLIDNYWVVQGTLPKRTLGGTFLIILDAKNCRILRMTHGK